jgi:hypothetical protein
MKLIGSSISLDELKILLETKWYWRQVSFQQETEDIWQVYNSKGLVDGLRVIQKKNRFRLEMKGE